MVERSGQVNELQDFGNEEQKQQPRLLVEGELTYPVNVPDDIHKDLNWDQPQ